MKAISSAANAQFRQWLRLASAPRAVRESALTLAEGLHLAQAALAAEVPLAALILRQDAAHAQRDALLQQLPPGVPRYVLPAALYERLAPVEQGSGLMLVVPVPAPPLPRQVQVDCVYLDGVQDPGNVGAILRTAAAAGVRHVLASAGTAALWAPKVLRAAMGAHFRLTLHERVEPAQLAGVLGGPWIAAVAHDAPSLWQQPLEDAALGWILGAEGSGPTAAALGASSRRVRVPTSDAVESLNVAAAAAICLFERQRRRQ